MKVKCDEMQENQSVTSVICSSYDSFFDAEKKIADTILENKAEVMDMTVAQLADLSGTSDATVSRFCRHCGFNGFHHLKISLAREIAEEAQIQLESQISNDVSTENIAQSLQNILANKVAELTQTTAMMDAGEIAKILKTIRRARIVQIAAVGNTIPVALDFSFKLNQIGIAAVSGTILETQLAFGFNLTKKDVVLVISNSGSSRRLVRLIEGAKENGAKIISITNNPQSPVAVRSDYHITTATREKLLMGEFCFSRVSATMVAEMVYLLLASEKRDSYDTIRRHEKAIGDDKL